MASSIPLIRASAVVPVEIWLLANNLPAADLLVATGLPPSPAAAPMRLVSLHAFFSLLESLAEAHGPDFGIRIATPEALMHLGVPARAILASRTVREALLRVTTTFHQHASHVFFRATEVEGGIEVAESIPISGTLQMHHQAQQHVAGLVDCLGILIGRPLQARVLIAPHPELGIEHLKPFLGDDIVAGRNRQLQMWIPDEVLDLEFPWEPDLHFIGDAESLKSAGSASLSESARTLIAGMIEDGNPGIDRLALCAGRSRRTLQRLLAAEGTTFAALLDSVRQDHALAYINEGHDSVSSIAQGVGFRNVSSLSRAVRRWTDTSPRQIRKDRRAG